MDLQAGTSGLLTVWLSVGENRAAIACLIRLTELQPYRSARWRVQAIGQATASSSGASYLPQVAQVAAVPSPCEVSRSSRTLDEPDS
jgi:hypothetical protein